MTVHYTAEFLEEARKVLTTEFPPRGLAAQELARQAKETTDHIRKNLEGLVGLSSYETPEIMLDLETLSLSPRAVVVSIGAVAFNVRHCCSVSDFKNLVGQAWGLSSPSFYRVLEIKPQQVKGREIDGDTVRWWMSQGDEAKKLFSVEPWNPYGVLEGFRSWVRHMGGKRLWANPTAFDVPKLESLCGDFGVVWPFTHRDYRDLKTLKAVTPPLDKTDYADLVSHHALDDAIYQALEVQRIYRYSPGLRAESDSDGAKQNGG